MSLLELSVDEFANVVHREVRFPDVPPAGFVPEISPEARAELRSPPVIDRYYGQLLRMLRSIELQMTTAKNERRTKAAEMDAAEFRAWLRKNAEWRTRTLRVRMAIEMRMAEVHRLRAELRQTPEVPFTTAAKLVATIHRHHEAYGQDAPDEILDAADRALWQVLEEPDVASLVRALAARPAVA